MREAAKQRGLGGSVWAACGAVAALLVAAPASQAAWTAPTDLSNASAHAYNPQLAVDPDGDVVFTYEAITTGSTNVLGRRLTGGALGTEFAVSSNAASPQVAMDQDGTAVWAYQDLVSLDNPNVQSQTQLLGGAFVGTERTVRATTEPEKPQVAVDPDGNAWFTWVGSNANDQVQARRLTAGNGPLTAVRNLSATGQDAISPQVAVDEDGDAVFTWTRFDGTNWVVQERRVTASNAVGPIRNVSTPGQDALDPQVGVDASGNAVFTWYRFDGTNWRVQARQLSDTDTFGTTIDVSAAGRNANSPQVAVDRHGDAFLAWRRFDGTNWRVQDANLPAGGSLGVARTLSAAGQDAAQPQVAINRIGQGVVVWRRFDGSKQRIEARTLNPVGAPGAITQLSAAGVNATTPQVAIDPAGGTAAVWRAGTTTQEATGP